MLLPIILNAFKIPSLVGLRLILSIFICEFSFINAATIKKEALDKSEGTDMSFENSFFPLIRNMIFHN